MSLKDVKGSDEQELKDSLQEAPEARFTPSFFFLVLKLLFLSLAMNSATVVFFLGVCRAPFLTEGHTSPLPSGVLADSMARPERDCRRDTLELLELFQFGKILTQRKQEESHADSF